MRARHLYILKDKIPVQEPDVLKWAKWFEESDRQVAFTRFGRIEVSTVFLAIDYAVMQPKPVLFETMIFGLTRGRKYLERCHTWEEAENMHLDAINWLKANNIIKPENHNHDTV